MTKPSITGRFKVNHEPAREFLAGQCDEEDVNVFSFSPDPDPIRCTGDDGKSGFMLGRASWRKLGEPAFITVTVRPVAAKEEA